MPSILGTSMNWAFKYLIDRLWSKIQGRMEKILSAAKRFSLNQLPNLSQSIQCHVSNYRELLVNPSHLRSNLFGGEPKEASTNFIGFLGHYEYAEIQGRIRI